MAMASEPPGRRPSVSFDSKVTLRQFEPESPEKASPEKARPTAETARPLGDEAPEDFTDVFAECIALRDYKAALDVCRSQLQKRPDDRYVLEMRRSVEQFLDAAEQIEAEAEEDADAEEDEAVPPELEEIQDQAFESCGRAYEAMFAYLKDEERLWALGEQAVGIFWDPGQLAAPGPRRDRLQEMSLELTRTLGRKLRSTKRAGKSPSKSAAAEPSLPGSEWLFEGLGQLWFQWELGVERDPWLVEGCLSEWNNLGGRMEELVGCSAGGLPSVPRSEMCDILMQVWTLERSLVCNLFEGQTPPAPLEFGIREVLAEIRRRPLTEPPLPGFYDDFYLMTHVVYALNCFNGHLPNRRVDCPWLYSYLERCLGFWLREAKREERGNRVPDIVTSRSYQAETVDAVAEAVDCLRGLSLGVASEGGSAASESVREGCAWLLGRQEVDGFFYSPGVKRPAASEYDTLHPSWTAVASLQFGRQAPGPSPRCALWAVHVRAAALEVGFAEPPPTRLQETEESLGDSDGE
eukprot:CAMPEP_0115073938 /NCGR_PEP_ID=MMETSP0227-20121206/15070_1 /TAXON_ID=89957 /ORGANISM="Polarella glacialis, Strain CCMP 1383" /LENGTH=520 /DNA_ID=CAMNT_0002460865 /DNA_START=45 /DNA_END=1608 /DNA_ORIENTATION=-